MRIRALTIPALIVASACGKSSPKIIDSGPMQMDAPPPPAGCDYAELADAANAAAATTSIDYKLKIVVDNPTTRCGKITAAANYTEAKDGANSVGNDMVDVRYVMGGTMNRVLTAATDAPEPTGIVTAAGTNYRITGTHANLDAAD